jgi:hypothetical protein
MSTKLMDRLADLLMWAVDEICLPFSLLSRWLRRKIPLWMAWDILISTWAPSVFIQRMHGKYLVWRDRRYRGTDEFHPSLDMNIRAMLTMTGDEKERYLEDLVMRRNKQHYGAIERRGGC